MTRVKFMSTEHGLWALCKTEFLFAEPGKGTKLAFGTESRKGVFAWLNCSFIVPQQYRGSVYLNHVTQSLSLHAAAHRWE